MNKDKDDAEAALLFLAEYLEDKRKEAAKPKPEPRTKWKGKPPGIPSRAEKRCWWVSRKRTS